MLLVFGRLFDITNSYYFNKKIADLFCIKIKQNFFKNLYLKKNITHAVPSTLKSGF